MENQETEKVRGTRGGNAPPHTNCGPVGQVEETKKERKPSERRRVTCSLASVDPYSCLVLYLDKHVHGYAN